jgi:serine/threonine protein kinase
MALPLMDRLDYMLQIVRALEFLHHKGISHEALATKKIMLTDSGVVKLAMLGRRGGNVLFKPFEEARDRSTSVSSQESIELLSPDMMAASALYDEDVMAWMVQILLQT